MSLIQKRTKENSLTGFNPLDDLSLKPRNRLAHDPLMKKGGAHVKSKSGKRSQEKVRLKKGEYD